jgi:hypothetical protein
MKERRHLERGASTVKARGVYVGDTERLTCTRTRKHMGGIRRDSMLIIIGRFFTQKMTRFSFQRG